MFDSSPYDSPTLNNSHVGAPISDRGADNDLTEDYPLKYASSYSLEPGGRSSTIGAVDLRLRANSSGDELQKLPVTNGRDVSEILVDFCGRTSSHGIPHIGSSPSLIGKLFWTVIFLACSVAFIMHTYYTIIIYLEYSVILQMQLEFSAVPFPAVTVCNLNPYKASMLSNETEIVEARIFDLNDEPNHSPSKRLKKRQVYYEIVYAKCRCLNSLQEECVPMAAKLEPLASICLCYLDVASGNIWPCYDKTVWHDHRCIDCSTNNACPFPPRAADPTKFETDEPCLCQNISRFCVKRHDGPIRFWEGYYHGTHYVTEQPKTLATSPKPNLAEDLDRNVERQEIVTFIVANMDPDKRRNLSYGRDEFIILCSFNGAKCHKERDFRLHDTPKHGNCYTYNFNASINLTNSRAGPLYGLRLLLNVNQADYLPYVEGAGVRVVVHHQTQYPFPDTFGYSAPVGAISSFGLKYKHFHRKGYPWSNCTISTAYDKTDKDYLFDEEYSTEGCYRSCVQKILVKNCKCNSHRFPKFRSVPICNYLDSHNNDDKKCTDAQEEQINKNNNCSCLQPCSEPVYQTSYSAASWPADNFSIKKEHCAIAHDLNQSCTDYNRNNTAFIEVFYEQLNYEKLTEVEATTIVNLFADFGGNIGLWIGFSTITVVEFLELALELFYHCYYTSTKPVRRWSRSKSMLGVQYVNQVAEQSYPPTIKKDFTVESSLSSPLGNNDVRHHHT